MRTPSRLALGLAAFAAVSAVQAGGPGDVDRTVKKEPAYRTKDPRYALLVFGPEAKDRVWLVHDGDTLYVDRDGDGDLTRPRQQGRPGSPPRAATRKTRTSGSRPATCGSAGGSTWRWTWA